MVRILNLQVNHMLDDHVRIIRHYLTVAEIWDALRVAAEVDLNLAQVIVESADTIISSSDMTLCYDERGLRAFGSDCHSQPLFITCANSHLQTFFIAGAKYELPKYVLSEPTNLIRDN